MPSASPTVRTRRSAPWPLLAALVVVLAACAGPTTSAPTPAGSGPGGTAAPTTSATLATATEASSTPSGGSDSPPALEIARVVDGLDSPLDVAVRPSDPEALYVVEQSGRIVVVRDGARGPSAFLDIASQVTAGGEQGLLGLAFHPDPADDRFFVYYTALDGRQVVAAFRAPPGPGSTADAGSEDQLLRMDDPFANHNGGGLAFGPDGYLYIATGDGGGAGDPLGSGRDLGSLLGKVLRVDVDEPGDVDRPYAIPADNPYVNDAAARPETWLSGLRNPWRIRFDRATGDLWIGDVGQGAWEEIDVARASVGGLDYGWNTMEGTHCFEPAEGCDQTGLTLPVTDYGHDEGCSVTGGTVYRGSAWPLLSGWYVFADYCSGTFWAVPSGGDGPVRPTVVLESERSISAIAEDASGELVATDLAAGELLWLSAPGR